MDALKTARMKAAEENDPEWNKFLEFINSHTKVGERPPYRDDDPFLIKKLEEAYKTFEEAPLPEWLVKKMNEKD